MTARKVLSGFRQYVIDTVKNSQKNIDDCKSVGGTYSDENICSAGQAVLKDHTVWERSTTTPVALSNGEEDEFDVFKMCFVHEAISSVKGEEWEVKSSRSYLFQDNIYVVGGNHSREQEALLVQEAFDAERRKFERLKNKFNLSAVGDDQLRRTAIPEDTRIAVWRRDGGKCAKCGSRERLEYDHIIPVSRGGNNSVRNIEMLCEGCNREKSNHIQ